MHLSNILNAIALDEGRATVDIGEDWGQGRASFGGLVAAVGNQAMRGLVPQDRYLRSLQTTFIGPAPAGTWSVDAEVVRVGRAVTVARCDIGVGGEIAATLVGVYGAPRPSAVSVPLHATPAGRCPEDLRDSSLPDGAPKFLQHFAVRWLEGPAMFTGVRTPGKAFVRHRDPAPPAESHVVAIADCLPTPAMSMYRAPAPASSLVWTLELLSHDFDFAPDAWWRIEHDTVCARDGYVSQTGTMYDPAGRPAALTRQLVAIFG